MKTVLGIQAPRPGDLLFFHGDTKFAPLIRFVQSVMFAQKSQYSHVAVCLWPNEQSEMLIHDIRATVEVHPWTDYRANMERGMRISVWRPTEGQHLPAAENLLKRYPEGTRYGYGKLLLGLVPDPNPICSAGTLSGYLEERFERKAPLVSWKRRGERRVGDGFVTVEALTLLKEEDGQQWLRYVGDLDVPYS